MIKLLIILAAGFISRLTIACSLNVGTYSCHKAPVTDIGKENVVIRDIVISKNEASVFATWNATGDIWVQDNENEGHFETRDFYYNFDLKLGKSNVIDRIYSQVACDKFSDSALTQIYYSQFFQWSSTGDSDILIRRIRYSQSLQEPKKLLISIEKYSEFFTCNKK